MLPSLASSPRSYAPVLFALPALSKNEALSADGLFAFLSALRTQVLLSGDVLWRIGQFHTTTYILMRGAVQLLDATSDLLGEVTEAEEEAEGARHSQSRQHAAASFLRRRHQSCHRARQANSSLRATEKRLSETHAAMYMVERPGSLLGFQPLRRAPEPMVFGARADHKSTCYSIDRQQLQELTITYDTEGVLHETLLQTARETILNSRSIGAQRGADGGGGAGGANGGAEKANDVDVTLHDWVKTALPEEYEENERDSTPGGGGGVLARASRQRLVSNDSLRDSQTGLSSSAGAARAGAPYPGSTRTERQLGELTVAVASLQNAL